MALVALLLLIGVAAFKFDWLVSPSSSAQHNQIQPQGALALPGPPAAAAKSVSPLGAPDLGPAGPAAGMTRFGAPRARLFGVIVESAHSPSRPQYSTGMALIGLDNEVARMVKTGSVVAPGWLLSAVSADSAVIVSLDNKERILIHLEATQAAQPRPVSPAPLIVAPPARSPHRPQGEPPPMLSPV